MLPNVRCKSDKNMKIMKHKTASMSAVSSHSLLVSMLWTLFHFVIQFPSYEQKYAT